MEKVFLALSLYNVDQLSERTVKSEKANEKQAIPDAIKYYNRRA